MAFKASTIRRKKSTQPIEGSVMIPNKGVEVAYRNALFALFKRICSVLTSEMTQSLEHPEVRRYFGDAAPTNMNDALKRAEKEIGTLIASHAKSIATDFILESDNSSRRSIQKIVEKFQIDMPSDVVGDLLIAQVNENVRLITNLSDDLHDKVGAAVTQSLQSGGQKALITALAEIEGFARKKVEFIAEDQTAKVYVTINTKRMQSAGIKKFRWVHSSAGKKPRHSHVERNNQIFLLSGGPADLFYEDGTDANAGLPAGDIGKPGHAPHCHCRMVAVLDV